MPAPEAATNEGRLDGHRDAELVQCRRGELLAPTPADLGGRRPTVTLVAVWLTVTVTLDVVERPARLVIVAWNRYVPA